jgi:hypothetical protein
MPFAFGINLPAFKMLDVAALEFEYFNNPYPNSYEIIFRQGNPHPFTKDHPLFSHGSWRWSVYARRSIKGFTFITQFSRDHLHPTHFIVDRPETFDVLPRVTDWWWTGKIIFGM